MMGKLTWISYLQPSTKCLPYYSLNGIQCEVLWSWTDGWERLKKAMKTYFCIYWKMVFVKKFWEKKFTVVDFNCKIVCTWEEKLLIRWSLGREVEFIVGIAMTLSLRRNILYLTILECNLLNSIHSTNS